MHSKMLSHADYEQFGDHSTPCWDSYNLSTSQQSVLHSMNPQKHYIIIHIYVNKASM